MDYSLFIHMKILNASMNVHFHIHTRRCICNSRDKQSMANFVSVDKYVFAYSLSCGN